MKLSGWFIAGFVALLLFTFTLPAQTDAASRKGEAGLMATTVVVERGPHHALRHWQTENEWPDGQKIVGNHYVTELATGLHYLKDGQWVPSQEIIEIFPDGAVACRAVSAGRPRQRGCRRPVPEPATAPPVPS
jgi:hypothetical protein